MTFHPLNRTFNPQNRHRPFLRSPSPVVPRPGADARGQTLQRKPRMTSEDERRPNGDSSGALESHRYIQSGPPHGS